MNEEAETPDEMPQPPEGSLIMRVKITEIPDDEEKEKVNE